jgi:uracil phosphoribosyltransferase
MAELRDIEIQQDGARFRNNLEKVGEVMAYEISKSLPYHERQIKTPLGNHRSYLLKLVIFAENLKQKICLRAVCI